MSGWLRPTLLALALWLLPAVAMSQVRSPFLLFAEQEDDVCNIRYWQEFAPEAVILGRVDECPDRLFVDARQRIVLLVDGAEIRRLRIYPAAEMEPIPMPDLDYRAWLNDMEPRPDRNEDYQPGDQRLLPIAARYLEDGALGLVMSLGMPADDEYHYLFRHDEGGWTVVAGRWCHRWGCDVSEDASDPFLPSKYVSTRGGQSWREERMIWHPSLLYSDLVSYRNERKHEVSPGRYVGSVLEIGFKIDGKESTLTTYVRPSEHSDTLHTLGINLITASGEELNLSKNQCLTSIVGRYLLVNEFFRGRFELTDLSTGETLFDNLSTAAWID